MQPKGKVIQANIKAEDASTADSLSLAKSQLSACSVHTAEPAAGGRAPQALPRVHCLWGGQLGASDQISPTGCFLAPPWDWQDFTRLTGECGPQWEKSPSQPLLPAPVPRASPPPLYTKGVEQRPVLHRRAGTGYSQWLYPVAEVWNKLFKTISWLTENVTLNWISFLISHSKIQPRLCETKPGNI